MRNIPKRPYDLKADQALIIVSKNEPGYMHKDVWFTVGSDCKGCPNQCGRISPVSNLADVEEELQEKLKAIQFCDRRQKAQGKHRRKKIKIFIQDFRKEQKGLEVFT